MEEKLEIEQRKIVPVAAMISAGKSKLLNILYNINYLECSSGIGTKFVNLLRYNPTITEPKFYHLKLEKKEDNYIFYKDLTQEEFKGGDIIKEEIHNINDQLRAEPKVNYEEIFYMLEIGESKFIKDEKYLLTHDLCDIPGLSEYQQNIKEKKEVIEKNEINKKKNFNNLVQEAAKNFSFISIPEQNEEKNLQDNDKKDILNEENFEDDIYKEIKNKEENTYLTEIFKIIKNNIDGGIIILSVENYFLEENFKIIAKLYKALGREITDFLILFNKIDLSVNPYIDIENCKSFLIQKFQKFQAFNLNSNTFIPISLNQLQNELLMESNYKNLINVYFYKYLSKIRNANENLVGETFINHLTNIIKVFTNKSREEIESKVDEFNERENIKEINKEIILILNELKENFKTNQFILGVSENDFDETIKDDILPDEIDEITELEKINPSYILKYLYICQEKNILIPPLSSTTNILLNYFKCEKTPQKKKMNKKKMNIIF